MTTDTVQAYRDGYDFAREELGTEADYNFESESERVSFRQGFQAGLTDLSEHEIREAAGMYGDDADPFSFGGVADWGHRDE